MSFIPQPGLRSVVAPPIAEVQRWIAGRDFPADRPLLDVSQAVPGYPPPAGLVEYLQRRLANPVTHLYTEILGRGKLRRALADDLGAVYGAEVDWRKIAITAGCNQAYCLCIDALARSGDEVIVTLPCYFNHEMWLQMRGVTPRYLAVGDNMLPSAADAQSLISGRTRAIVLVSPNNPSGAVYPADLLHEFYELAKRRGIALIIDETYRDFRDDESPPHRLFAEETWDQTFIHLYSFSKAFAMTGYRVGAIAANDAFLEEIAKIMDCAIICAPHIGQEAAIRGLTHHVDWRTETAAALRQRVSLLRECFSKVDTHWQLVASGAFFAYVRHPFQETSMAVARRLADDANVLSLPGGVFGKGQEGYLRFAFANLDTAAVPELVARLS